MKRTALLGLGIVAGALGATAQGGWLVDQDSIQLGTLGGSARSIRETPNGYLIFCHQVSSFGTNRTHVFTRLLDSDGAMVSELEFGTDTIHQNLGYIDPIANCASGGYAATVLDFTGGGTGWNIGYLYRFDANGDTVWAKELWAYPPADSLIGLLRCAIELPDGGFALGGAFDTPNATSDAQLIRTNALGDTLWTKLYMNVAEILSIDTFSNGDLLLAGYRFGPGMDRAWLMRTDSVGNTLWTKYMGGWGDTNANAIALADGSSVVSTSYRDSQWWFNEFQMMLTKYSPTGGLIWQKRCYFGPDVSSQDIEELPDGSFIAANSWGNRAVLLRYSATGDSIWSREYIRYYNGNLLRDIELCSDGGFIAAGHSFQTIDNPHPGLETILILKTDSFGCVVPGCQNVGVGEYEISLQEQLQVWPNPASDRVQFELAMPEGYPIVGAVRAVLLDATGQQVLQENIRTNGNLLSHSLTLSSLSAGLYYLHLADEKRWLAGGKVVVE